MSRGGGECVSRGGGEYVSRGGGECVSGKGSIQGVYIFQTTFRLCE